MSNKNKIIIGVVLLLLIALAFFLFSGQKPPSFSLQNFQGRLLDTERDVLVFEDVDLVNYQELKANSNLRETDYLSGVNWIYFAEDLSYEEVYERFSAPVGTGMIIYRWNAQNQIFEGVPGDRYINAEEILESEMAINFAEAGSVWIIAAFDDFKILGSDPSESFLPPQQDWDQLQEGWYSIAQNEEQILNLIENCSARNPVVWQKDGQNSFKRVGNNDLNQNDEVNSYWVYLKDEAGSCEENGEIEEDLTNTTTDNQPINEDNQEVIETTTTENDTETETPNENEETTPEEEIAVNPQEQEQVPEETSENIEQTPNLENGNQEDDLLSSECSQLINSNQTPQFALNTLSQEGQEKFLTFEEPEFLNGKIKYQNNGIEAEVECLGDNFWNLTVNNLSQNTISNVYFPYDFEEKILNENEFDDVIYYPRRSGMAYKASIAGGVDGDKWHQHLQGEIYPCYPGECFSPLIIKADDFDYELYAAASWPPKAVTPQWSKNKMRLKFESEINAGGNDNFQIIKASGEADLENAKKPWQIAIDVYREWFLEKIKAEGLEVDYPQWLRKTHGYVMELIYEDKNYENGFELDKFRTKWDSYKDIFPYLQIWGQMAGFPYEGRAAGCCLLDRDIDESFLTNQNNILDLVDEIKNEGKRVGFYQRGYRPSQDSGLYFTLDSNMQFVPEGEEERVTQFEYLKGWIEKNEIEYRSNAFYIDVLGAAFFGDPLNVAKMFVEGEDNYLFREGSIIEHPIDIYPTAYLAGGDIYGGIEIDEVYKDSLALGGPFKEIGRDPVVTFPQMARYLLRDRIFFSGYSNGDYLFWGKKKGENEEGIYHPGTIPDGNRLFSNLPAFSDQAPQCNEEESKCNYFTERQLFLLGNKIEGFYLKDNFYLEDSELNEALKLIIDLRNNFNWWERDLVYLDTNGLKNVPDEIEVRVFADKNGEILFAIDNWSQVEGLSFEYLPLNQTIEVPTYKLSVLEVD